MLLENSGTQTVRFAGVRKASGRGGKHGAVVRIHVRTNEEDG